MIKVKNESLKVKRCFEDGSPKLYSADLRHFDLPRKDLDKIKSILKKLRTLNEISINLTATIDIIHEFESDNSRGFGSASWSNKNEALFSMATTLYCSCFLRGENDAIPISVLEEEITPPPIHDKVRAFRDKRLCHLDKDHEVRSNKVNWLFLVDENNKLKPCGADFQSQQVVFFLGEDNKEWIKFINELLHKLTNKTKTFEEEVNSFFSALEIDNVTK